MCAQPVPAEQRCWPPPAPLVMALQTLLPAQRSVELWDEIQLLLQFVAHHSQRVRLIEWIGWTLGLSVCWGVCGSHEPRMCVVGRYGV